MGFRRDRHEKSALKAELGRSIFVVLVNHYATAQRLLVADHFKPNFGVSRMTTDINIDEITLHVYCR